MDGGGGGGGVAGLKVYQPKYNKCCTYSFVSLWGGGGGGAGLESKKISYGYMYHLVRALC